jgi:hypothetical protein
VINNLQNSRLVGPDAASQRRRILNGERSAVAAER